MKKLPYGSQRGGGRFRSPYKYTKKDCDCRLCLYYRKKTGCTLSLCPCWTSGLDATLIPLAKR